MKRPRDTARGELRTYDVRVGGQPAAVKALSGRDALFLALQEIPSADLEHALRGRRSSFSRSAELRVTVSIRDITGTKARA